MNCTKARELMSAAVDGELNRKEEQEFFQHLSVCKSCVKEYEDAKKTKLIVREKIVRFKAPQSLVNSIMQLNTFTQKEKTDTILHD